MRLRVAMFVVSLAMLMLILVSCSNGRPEPTSIYSPTPVAPTATPAPTSTLAPTAGTRPTSVPVPSPAPAPTATAVPVPTATPFPIATPQPTPTPRPAFAPTSVPVPSPAPASTTTATPTPTFVTTRTPTPTSAPVSILTAVPAPTSTPMPTPANTPTPVPTDTPKPIHAPTSTHTPTPANAPTPVPTDTAIPIRTPTQLPTGSSFPSAGESFVAVSSGGYHTCALRANGEVMCWGAHPKPDAFQRWIDRGQASPPENERFVSISSGLVHTCGLRDDGTVVCWGFVKDDWGDDDLGGTTIVRLGLATSPVWWGQTPPPEGEVFVSISSGGGHTCGLRENGSAACWGNDAKGQASPPKDERFVSISSGMFHTCGHRYDDTAVCWGPEPYWGGFTAWQETPDTPYAWIAAGAGFTCGQPLDRGEMECWGWWQDALPPPKYPSRSNRFVAFSAGGGQSCGLLTDRTAVCRGIVDDFWTWKDPDKVWWEDVWMGPRQFASISSGYFHTCAIGVDEVSLVCWGSDDYGQSSPPGGERLERPEPVGEPPS